jgi:hypothetical protein
MLWEVWRGSVELRAPQHSRLLHIANMPSGPQVRRQLALALPIGYQLSQHHLWLVEAPPGIMQVVWDVVAIAAVHAMFARRKHMCSPSFAGAEDPQVCVQAGCARAKSAFWQLHPRTWDGAQLRVGAQLWSLVVSLVLFVLLQAILLFSTCVPMFPFCMLLVFCLNFLYLCFPCSNVPLALLFAL